MIHMPKLSIIIPVYNVAPYLRACLDSLRRQTRGDWEAICVDDGSTDGSGVILDEYALKDTRFKVIHQTNQGVSQARNCGLDRAAGEWIGFLDADDEFAADAFEKALSGGTDCFDAIGFGVVLVSGDGKTRDFGKVKDESEIVISGDDLLMQWRHGNYKIFNYCVANKFFRRKIIGKFKLRFVPGMKYGEDSLFATSFLSQCDQVLLRPQIKIYRYNMREGSAIHTHAPTFPPTFQFEYVRVYYDIWKRTHKRGVEKRLRECLGVLFLTGCNSGMDYRSKCVNWMIGSSEFNHWARVALSHGNLKLKVVALSYVCSPKWLKRKILIKIGELASNA